MIDLLQVKMAAKHTPFSWERRKGSCSISSEINLFAEA